MGTSGQARNTISLDQLMARHLGVQHAFVLLYSAPMEAPVHATANGAMIPPEDSPSRLFSRLFINDSSVNGQNNRPASVRDAASWTW